MSNISLFILSLSCNVGSTSLRVLLMSPGPQGPQGPEGSHILDRKLISRPRSATWLWDFWLRSMPEIALLSPQPLWVDTLGCTPWTSLAELLNIAWRPERNSGSCDSFEEAPGKDNSSLFQSLLAWLLFLRAHFHRFASQHTIKKDLPYKSAPYFNLMCFYVNVLVNHFDVVHSQACSMLGWHLLMLKEKPSKHSGPHRHKFCMM